ncbi:hypothetical protein [Thermomonospora amylolytica]|uniref:hypothetical protein n=1 Tax=Thermomonospora amylolytica TaxID=1411117 RepID=UPI000E6B6156|nr:hypothetical protein [Thermomonospora amylolytica]
MTRDVPKPANGREETTPDRVYPVKRGDRIDYRFTDGLLTDVAGVLAARGYPTIDPNGGDYEELAFVLWNFIYGRPTR